MDLISFTTLLLFSTNVLLSEGQNCGITGIDETILELPAMLETTASNTLIWESEIYNVTYSEAVNTPHFNYIVGLRYNERYEYLTSNIFSSFLDTERTLYIQRNTTFYCEDGGRKSYFFLIPVIDENTNPPEFFDERYDITVTLPWPPSIPINRQAIVVGDRDFEERNANLTFTISSPLFQVTAIKLWTQPYPEIYYYKLDILFAQESIQPGRYQTILTADDGNFGKYVPVTIIVQLDSDD